MVVPGFLKTWLNSSLSWRPLFYKAIIRPKAACLAGVPRGQVLSLFLSQIPRSLNIPFVLARLLAVVSSPLATLLFAPRNHFVVVLGSSASSSSAALPSLLMGSVGRRLLRCRWLSLYLIGPARRPACVSGVHFAR